MNNTFIVPPGHGWPSGHTSAQSKFRFVFCPFPDGLKSFDHRSRFDWPIKMRNYRHQQLKQPTFLSFYHV